MHASERRWTAPSCLTGHDHTFSLWMPSYRAMGYKSKGNGKSWGDGACRRGYGRPERERSHKTSLFLLWLMLHPIPPTGGTGFRYRIRLLPGLACGILPDGTIPWLSNRDFKQIETLNGVHRSSTLGEVLCTDRDIRKLETLNK